MKPRVFLAGLFHETNTFVAQPTTLADFEVSRGAELLAFLGNGSPMDGFLHAARDFGWEVVPGVDFRCAPSGPVDDAVLETFWNELRARLETALKDGLDAIFLVLHGAMATVGEPDVEGEILERIRQLPGAETLPVFAVLDLHANVSERMARHASALVPYRENPHTDARETALRAARHLRKSLSSHRTPHTVFLPARVLLAPPSTGTADAPMRELEAMARTLEKSAGHWEVGVAAGFAHADTPDTGLSFWVVSEQPEISCHKTLETLFQEARALARKVRTDEWDLSAALDRIATEKKYPALLVEPADNIGGGTAGDSTFILRALLERPFARGGVVINDPSTVDQLAKHAPGDVVRVALGGRGSQLDPGPVDLDVTLVRLTDGVFTLEDSQSHLASMRGTRIAMGPSAVVTHGSITILITSQATPPFDLGQWRSQGIDPESLEIIGVKAAVGHRRAYDAMAKSSYTVRTPGPGTSDLKALPYKHLRRPIYPLDD